MTFDSPGWLWSLLIVPATVAGYVAWRRLRRKRTASLAAQGLVATGAGRREGWRIHLPITLFVLALALLAVATARPTTTVKTPRRQATVIVAMDISNSMAATDAKPTRLDVAKTAATDFVRAQPPSVKVGVVAFGPTAQILRPPTSNHAEVLQVIKQLAVGGGTSLASGILSSLDTIAGKTLTVNQTTLNEDNSGTINIGYYGGATILLISDGENTSQTNPVTMARLASTAGVRIQTIGVGTVAGTTLNIDGFSVATALDPQTLQDVAKVTNGAYHQVNDRGAVADVSKAITLHFAVLSQYTQVTALFAAAGAVILAIGGLLSVLWFGRVL